MEQERGGKRQHPRSYGPLLKICELRSAPLVENLLLPSTRLRSSSDARRNSQRRRRLPLSAALLLLGAKAHAKASSRDPLLLRNCFVVSV